MAEPTLILFVVFFLLFKHFLADFVLQSDYILCNRHRYGHPGGLLHATLHGLLSGLVFLAVGASFPLVVLLVIGEIIAHYHIDWLKDNLTSRWGLTSNQRGYWVLMGSDQLLHQATYIVMVWIWVANSSTVAA